MVITTQKPVGRSGRPRNSGVEKRAVLAAIKILADVGCHGLSFAKVSQMTGIARPTLKLRWPSKEELCIATVKYVLDETRGFEVPEDLTGLNIRTLTVSVLASLIESLRPPETIRILTSIVSAMHFSEPLGELRQYVLSRRGIVLRRLLQAGIDNGEFAKSTDIDFSVDALNGPIIYHTLILGMPMIPHAAKTIVNMVLPIQKEEMPLRR